MRLDIYLTEKGYIRSRSLAQELIKSGSVSVNGKIVNKPSFSVEAGAEVDCRPTELCKYVSRGGLKLEAALKEFNVSPFGKVCADIGASTGGFTDCLLQNGALKVYAVDSGTAQLDKTLKDNKKVFSLENFNARYLSERDIPEKCDIVVMDVSFISQTKLYSAVSSIISEGGIFISLIKPQFEVGPSGIGKGGIVTDEKTRLKAVNLVCEAARSYNFVCHGTITSPIKGGDGNTEYLGYFTYEKREGDIC